MKIFYDCDEAEFKRFAKKLGVDDEDGSRKYIILWSWKDVLKWIVIILLAPLFITVGIALIVIKTIVSYLDKALGDVGRPIKIIRLVKKEEII